MPSYFAFPSSAAKPAQNSVEIGQVRYDPAEISQVKTSARPYLRSTLSTIFFSFISLFISVFSREQYTYAPLQSRGAKYRKSTLLPFRKIGHGFALKRNVTIDPSTVSSLIARGYTEMTLNKRTIFLKEEATAEDYLWVDDNMTGLDDSMIIPTRYLNHTQFYGHLTLLSITSAICLGLSFLSSTGQEERHNDAEDSFSVLKEGQNIATADQTKKVPMITGSFPEFSSKGNPAADDKSDWVQLLKQIFHLPKLGSHLPGVMTNPFDSKKTRTYFTAKDKPSESHGIVFPFRSDLCLPDVSIIGDTLSRFFTPLLGLTEEEQLENLNLIRVAVGGIRMTRLGDEIAHLYKCISIAVEAQSGLCAIFSGSTYDGSVVQGGTGSTVFIGKRLVDFSPADIVKKELGLISIHRTALEQIANFFPNTSQAAVLGATSMVELRRLCLSGKFTQDEVSKIIGIARGLDFGHMQWTITPDRLLSCFRLMTDKDKIVAGIPISNQALFSSDMVLVSLSVFGNNNCPSWNIPSGTLRKLTGKAIPAPPPSGAGKIRGGGTDDGPWVMEVRTTTLEKAVVEFNEMATLGGYRTVPSQLAHRQHYRVFQGNRVAVFWSEMQAAYGVANKSFDAADRDDSATLGKRSPGSAQGGGPAKKARNDI